MHKSSRVILLLVALCLVQASEAFAGRLTYYTASKGGQALVLLPSAHAGLPAALWYSQTLADGLARLVNTRGICLETSANDKDQALREFFINERYSAARLLSPSIQKKLITEVDPNIRLLLDRHATPWLLKGHINGVISRKFSLPHLNAGLEEYLQTRAARGSKFHGVEDGTDFLADVGQFASLYSDIDKWERYLEHIRCEACLRRSQSVFSEALTHLFVEGRPDLFEAKVTQAMADAPAEFDQQFIHSEHRMLRMYGRLVDHVNEGRCDVLAIGASHFFGRLSILEYLANQGYTISTKYLEYE
jgi:uncharacterized protein YbaP (TraB family)